MHITFDSASDTRYIYKLLSKAKNKQLKVKMNNPQSLLIEILKNEEECIRTTIIPAFMQFILNIKEPQYVRYFLNTMFFYEDETEQLQIIQMVQSLVRNKKERLHPSLRDRNTREEILERALSMFLTKDVHFSFEAFLTFRLKEYLVRLQDYIEVAIDEYKLEQDYQDFIESLRKYISMKNGQIDFVKVVCEKENYIFYDKDGNKLNVNCNEEEQFVSNYGFEVEQQLIAPLLWLCPKSIHVYCTNNNHAIIQTLINIFQERVTLLEHEHFTGKKTMDYT